MRSHEVPEVRQALRSALGDAHPMVQRAAWARLGERSLSQLDLAAMAEAIDEGRLAGSNLQVAMGALARDRGSDAARMALAALVDHPGGDPNSRARARALLGR